MFYIVDIAKALACLLIANFHSDILFPEELSLLAFGGDVGNNIFFLVSGFALWPSASKCESKDFGKWYLKRVLRLLPMLAFFYLVNVLSGGVVIDSFSDAVRAFIFPTMYWFTGAIILFYFLFFILEKYTNDYFRIGLILLLIILHLYWDNLSTEIYFIGFIAMLTGAGIRKRLPVLTANTKAIKTIPLSFFVTGLFYVILKLMRGKGLEVLGFIHLGIGILTICLAAEIILWGSAYEKSICGFFQKHSKAFSIIKKLSESTLAVYLLMGVNDRILMRAIGNYLIFPVSYIINMAISLLGAYAITVIDKKLRGIKK